MKKESSHPIKEPLAILKTLYLSRFSDEKMAILAKQNKGGTFQLSAAGHELVGAVAATHLIRGKDWSFPYFRDQAFAISLGCDLSELFGAFLGRKTKNHSSGRMMPYHYSEKALRIFCQSSVVGSQFLQAAGRALGAKNLKTDEVVYVSAGDGATSQGDFYESLNFSSIHRLPLITVIQNNGWAISVPSKEQTAGGSIVGWTKEFPDLMVADVDGCDYKALTVAFSEAVKRARAGKGPALIHARVSRLSSHSNSDDERKYRTEENIAIAQLCDPILSLERFIVAEKRATQEEIEVCKKEAHTEVERAAAQAEKLPFPDAGSSRQFVFLPFESLPSKEESEPIEGEKVVMVEAIRQALSEEMERDSHVVVFGEDVADGKGGAFGATRGLTTAFGKERCFNTPLAESTIVGVSVGLGADGLYRPVAEIQYIDYLWTGINQLVNEAASIAYRSNGEWGAPLVLRLPYGGYIQGGPYHSQSLEGFLAHCPGLKIVIPSNAADARALLKTAIRDPNPVLFFEHKLLYRNQKFSARRLPTKEFLLPFGQAKIIHEGSDLTVVVWGLMVLFASEIAEKLKREQGVSIEVIDLRTLVPLDMATLTQSVKKTGKMLIAHEAPKSAGFGAELAARIAEETFEYLDAPIARVGGFEAPIPYSQPLEKEILPQPADLEAAILKLLRY